MTSEPEYDRFDRSREGTRVNVGPAELIIVLMIVLLVFGGAKLPGLARSMGQAAREFRSGLHDEESGPED